MVVMPKTVKLTYFNIQGLAESCRIAFHASKVPFEDVRLSKEEFMEMKPTYLMGQLPVAEIDGRQITQSGAILRYAGRLANLYPEDAFEAMLVDEVCGIVMDFRMKLVPTVHESDETKKMEMRKKLVEETLPPMFAKFDKFLAARGKKFCASDKMAICDLELSQFVCWMESGILDGIPKDICVKYTEMMKVVENTRNHEIVKAYYASVAK